MKIAAPIVVFLAMLLVIVGCTPAAPTPIERPSDIPEPYTHDERLGGPEDDLVIVRSQGTEYVQLNGLVFVWQHGTNLIGVYGKNGLMQTNISSLTAITNITVMQTNQVQQIEK